MLLDDFELVLERAKKAGVEKLMITGTNLADSKEAIEMTKQSGHGKRSWTRKGKSFLLTGRTPYSIQPSRWLPVLYCWLSSYSMWRIRTAP
jgi:Tat protein secretion system quality control protein TatD with DNase activity